MSRAASACVVLALCACSAEATSPSATTFPFVVDTKEKKKMPMPEKTETAVLAGGCFWGMEEILRKAPGVLDIEAGYTGGWLENPRYDDTHDSKSGHAEAIKVIYDPTKITYAQILDDWFFRMHDPTTENRQGNDVGTQYRSAIFPMNAEQAKEAAAAKQRAAASGRWKKPVVTTIEPFSKWWPAEDYHQDYLQKHPGGYTCHWMRE
jgi:methionine-S-sulfoxide reductase